MLTTTSSVRNIHPKSKRFVDLSGTTTRHGVKVLRRLGFGQKADGTFSSISIYECQCPLCNGIYRMWGNQHLRNKSCGCLRLVHDGIRTSEVVKAGRTYYSRLRRDQQILGKDLQPFDRFWSLFVQHFTEGFRLARLDDSEPLSMQNHVLLKGTSSKNLGRVIRVEFQGIGMGNHYHQLYTMPDCSVLLGVSRQRVHQMDSTHLEHRMLAEIYADFQASWQLKEEHLRGVIPARWFAPEWRVARSVGFIGQKTTGPDNSCSNCGRQTVAQCDCCGARA